MRDGANQPPRIGWRAGVLQAGRPAHQFALAPFMVSGLSVDCGIGGIPVS